MSFVAAALPPVLRLPLVVGCISFVIVGCGGGSQSTAPSNTFATVSAQTAPSFAAGPIQSACKSVHRTRATAARCGCVQAAANRTLSPDEQRRAAGYFFDPEALQKRKLSDSAANERFWDRWERFAETAESMCKNT